MKLILVIVSNDDGLELQHGLVEEGYQVTKLASTGGFLKAGNTTLIIGCEDESVDSVIEIIKKYSSKHQQVVPNTASYDMGMVSTGTVKVTVGGATIFVLEVDQFLKI